MLLSTPSMKVARFLLGFEWDCVFTPDLESGEMGVYDGMYYRFPADRVSNDIRPERYRVSSTKIEAGHDAPILNVVPIHPSVGTPTDAQWCGEVFHNVSVPSSSFSAQNTEKFRNLFREFNKEEPRS